MKINMVFPGVLLLFIALTPVSSTVSGTDLGRTAEERACDELRREMAMLLRLVYEKKAWPNNLKKLLPNWVESYLPANCGKRRSSRRHFNRPPIDTKGVVAMSSKIRHKREIIEGNFENEVSRDRRSTLAAADAQWKAILRERRNTHVDDVASHKDGSAVLARQKRFLAAGSAVGAPDFSAMTLGSVNPGPPREISESAQMMNNLLMLTKLQKSRVSQEYRSIRRNSYVGDRISFGSGMYGDTYPAKRKREVANNIANNEVGMEHRASVEASLRRKRFLFAMEPAEMLSSPSLFGIYQGTALDPNTGKRLEFGGEVMKNAFGSTLMSFLPPGFRPPPGKEPGDFIKTIAPLLLNNAGSPGTAQKRNRNGLFGDTLPGKKRKRSPDETKNTDVVKFGDVSVPVDIFGIKGEGIQPDSPSTLLPLIYLINQDSIPPKSLPQSIVLPPHNNNKLWDLVATYYNPYQPFLHAPPHFLLGRRKRSTNSDVVTIGDVTIPVDFFKPHDQYSYEDSRSERDSSPPKPQPQQNSKKAAQNTHHLHQSYQSIINGYKQALYNSQYNNLYLYKFLQKPVIHQPSPVVYQNLPHLPVPVSHAPRYATYLPQPSSVSYPRPPFHHPPPALIQHAGPIIQTHPSVIHISPVPFQPKAQPPFISNLPPLPLNPPPPFPLNPPPPLPLIPPPPPYIIPPPLPLSYQPPPPSKSLSPLPPIHNLPPPQYVIAPTSSQYALPPADPFLPSALQPGAHRLKRSADTNDKSSNSYSFYPSIFPINPASIFAPTPYIPPVYSTQSNKVGHRAPAGDIIYGDVPVWQQRSSSNFLPRPLVSSSRYSAANANSHTSPIYNFARFPTSLTPSVLPQLPSIVYRPAQTSPLGVNTASGVVYGDRVPWSGFDTPAQISGPLSPQQINTPRQGGFLG